MHRVYGVQVMNRAQGTLVQGMEYDGVLQYAGCFVVLVVQRSCGVNATEYEA